MKLCVILSGGSPSLDDRRPKLFSWTEFDLMEAGEGASSSTMCPWIRRPVITSRAG